MEVGWIAPVGCVSEETSLGLESRSIFLSKDRSACDSFYVFMFYWPESWRGRWMSDKVWAHMPTWTSKSISLALHSSRAQKQRGGDCFRQPLSWALFFPANAQHASPPVLFSKHGAPLTRVKSQLLDVLNDYLALASEQETKRQFSKMGQKA